MAKLTKKALKGIVKECLVEILSEGLEGNISESNERRKTQLRMKNEERALQERRQKLETKIDSTVSSITDDSIMQSILADTARTTLKEQICADRGGTSSGFWSPGPGLNIDSIFSESNNNWSSLAFGDKSTKS